MFHTFISVVASLFIIEILLSVDNALVNATLAEKLPEGERKKAIRIGIALGALFRFIALFVVAFIIQNIWIKVLGALYLIYLAVMHLGKAVNTEGHTLPERVTFRGVVTQIAVADIVFSIDNVISAVSFSSNTYLVMFGVFVGIIGMLFITPLISRLVHHYQGMPQAAYVIVGLIGVSLLLETFLHIHIMELTKFIIILCIIGFTVWYEHSAIVRRISTPILIRSRFLIAIPLDIIYSIKNVFRAVSERLPR